MSSPALSYDALDAAVAALPDNGLSSLRKTALERLRDTGLPGTREEDWKYTDLSTVIETTNAWLDDGAAVSSPASVEAPPGADVHWLRIVNGQIDNASLESLPEGVAWRRRSDAVAGLTPAGRLGELNIAVADLERQ